MSAERQEGGPGKVASTAVYLVPGQVAELLQLSVKSIYRLAKDNPDMPALKLGGTVRFPKERLLRWLQDREQGRPARPRMPHQVRAVANPASGKEHASA